MNWIEFNLQTKLDHHLKHQGFFSLAKADSMFSIFLLILIHDTNAPLKTRKQILIHWPNSLTSIKKPVIDDGNCAFCFIIFWEKKKPNTEIVSYWINEKVKEKLLCHGIEKETMNRVRHSYLLEMNSNGRSSQVYFLQLCLCLCVYALLTIG